MDAAKLIEQFKVFFDSHKSKVLYYTEKKRKWVKLEFNAVSKFDPEIGDSLLDNPEEVIKAAEIALNDYCMVKGLSIRIFNIPKTQQRNIWELRFEDIGKFIALKGIINKSTSIQHISRSARFECPSCGNVIPVLMTNEFYREPSKCGCGHKGKFHKLSDELVDTIKIGLMDDLLENDNIDRSVAREKICVLKNELTMKEIDQQIKPGKKVICNGWLQTKQKGPGSVEFESVFIVNSITFVKVGWDTVIINEEEKDKIIEVSKDSNIIKRLAESVASVYGYEHIKKCCILQLAGAPNIYDGNSQLASRGTIHILLIGNPGSSKTFIVKRFGKISPISIFQSASNASGKGLVASVAQDKDLGGWAVYPGIVPMASKGIAIIDEVDKTAEEDYGDHNLAMNDMIVGVAKANVKAQLETETSYLATANPENRVFTNDESYFNQIAMPHDFLDRFDIILPVESPKQSSEADKVMDIMLERHICNSQDKSVWLPEFTIDFIRKYIAYCRQNMPNPTISKELFPYIKERLHELMKPRDESQTKVSFRQLEVIMRFAYASARLHLRNITKEDIDLSFELKKKSFIDLGVIDEHGQFQWATLENINEKQVHWKSEVLDILRACFAGKKECQMQEIMSMGLAKGVPEDKIELLVAQLLQKGDYYEPRRGVLARI